MSEWSSIWLAQYTPSMDSQPEIVFTDCMLYWEGAQPRLMRETTTEFGLRISMAGHLLTRPTTSTRSMMCRSMPMRRWLCTLVRGQTQRRRSVGGTRFTCPEQQRRSVMVRDESGEIVAEQSYDWGCGWCIGPTFLSQSREGTTYSLFPTACFRVVDACLTSMQQLNHPPSERNRQLLSTEQPIC